MSQAEVREEQAPKRDEKDIYVAADQALNVSKQLLMLLEVSEINAMQQAIALVGALASVVLADPQIVDPLIKFLRNMIDTMKEAGEDNADVLGKLAELLPIPGKGTAVLGKIVLKKKPLFHLGEAEIFPNVVEKMKPSRVMECIGLHLQGEWGPYVDEEDGAVNLKHAQEKKGKIFSIHKVDPEKDLGDDNKFYIITNEDHTETQVMMPEEFEG